MKQCPACGNKYNDELQVCIVDGASLMRFDPQANTLTMSMSEDDKIIELASTLRDLSEGKREFVVKYAELERRCGFEPSEAKKYLEAAAQEAGLEIVRQGESQASLIKINPIAIA